MYILILLLAIHMEISPWFYAVYGIMFVFHVIWSATKTNKLFTATDSDQKGV